MRRYLFAVLLLVIIVCQKAQAQGNQVIQSGGATAPAVFPGTGCTYYWVNNNPAIGLLASGVGNIPSFIATNNGTTTINGTITATTIPSGIAYIPNSGDGTVAIYNANTNVVTGHITTGGHPQGATVSPDGRRVYITDPPNRKVYVVNTATNSIIATIPVGFWPYGVTVSADGSRVYVGNNLDGEVSVINATNNTVIATVPVGTNPIEMLLSANGSKLYVANHISDDITVINTATNTVITTIALGVNAMPWDLALSPDGSKLYVGNSSVQSVAVINTSTDIITSNIPLGFSPMGIAISPDGTKLYAANPGANSVSIINLANNSTITTIPVGDLPQGMSITPDGTQLIVVNNSSNNISVINTATNTVTSTVPTGPHPIGVGNFITPGSGCASAPITFTITVDPPFNQTLNNGEVTKPVIFSGTSCIYNWVNDKPGIGLPATGTGNIAAFTAINNSNSPIVATITATPAAGGVVYVSNTGSNNVSVVNTTTNTVTATIPVGFVPGAIITSPDGTRVYVINGMANTMSVINTATNTVIATLPTGSGAGGSIAISADGSRLYVPNTNLNTVTVYNGLTNTVVATINVGVAPYGIVLSPDGTRAYVSNSADGTVSIINTANNTVSTIGSGTGMAGASSHIAISPDGTLLYVSWPATRSVVVTNLVNNSIVTNIPMNSVPYGLTVSPNGDRLYIATFADDLFIINTANNIAVNSVHIPGGQKTASISADGAFLYVANSGSNTIAVLNTQTATVDRLITVGSNPGNVAAFTGCTGSLVTFTITVNAIPTITTGTVTGNITACWGNASASPAIQQFTVSGGSLNADIVATAPAGFELSLTQNSGYGNTLTLPQTSGNVSSTIIYVRSSASAAIGGISGNVKLTSGALTKMVLVAGIVNALPTVNAVADQLTGNGQSNAAINFAGTSNTFYNWANDTPGIGLTPVGIGSLPAFTAINTGTTPIVATITVTPQTNGTGCTGTPITFKITVNPSPPIITTTNATGTISACAGQPSASPAVRQFTISGNSLTNNITATAPVGFEVSLTATGSYGASVTLVQTAGMVSSTILYVRAAASAISGPISGNVTLISGAASQALPVNGVINPLPSVNPISNQTVVSGANTTAVNFTGINALFTWTNNTPGIGLAANGTGNIASFKAVNTGAFAVTATITVTPLSSGTGCTGNPVTFTITVNAAPPLSITPGTPIAVNTTYGTASAASTFTVSAASLTGNITITAPAGFEVSSNNITFGNTASIIIGASGAVDSAPVYIRLKATTHAGTYSGDITFSSAGVSTTAFMPNSIVGPASLTIIANDVNKPYGSTLTGGPGSTAFTATGLKNGETIATATIIYDPTAATATAPAGSYPHSVIINGIAGGTFLASDYTGVNVDGTITVTPVALTIKADDQTKNFGDPNPILTITYSGFMNNETAGQLTTPPTVTTSATLTSIAGVYPITVSGAASTNYTFVYLNGSLTVYAVDLPLVIPNTFTPNGDGLNDTWIIKNIQLHPTSTVNIYNRYGGLVFTSIGYTKVWDGLHKGVPVPTGTYYYVIDLKDNTKPTSGSITILR